MNTGGRKVGCGHKHHGGVDRPEGRFPSSAWMHDPKMVLGSLPLKNGDVFVDLGCGAGDYSMEASRIVGHGGKVLALDKWKNVIDSLSEKARSHNLGNISALTTDIADPLPINDNSIDLVFIATVLHILELERVGPFLFTEIFRILKPSGCLAIVECKKEEQDFGPAKHLRHAPEEIEAVVLPRGFKRTGYMDLGYNYLIQFTRVG